MGIAQPKSKVKQVKMKTLHKNLWEVTRLLCFELYGRDCYTCQQRNLVGVNCQGGHVPWPDSILSAECAYDYVNYIRPQCYDCNMNKGGMGAIALDRMKREGVDVDALWQSNLETKGQKYGRDWYVNETLTRRLLLKNKYGIELRK